MTAVSTGQISVSIMSTIFVCSLNLVWCTLNATLFCIVLFAEIAFRYIAGFSFVCVTGIAKKVNCC